MRVTRRMEVQRMDAGQQQGVRGKVQGGVVPKMDFLLGRPVDQEDSVHQWAQIVSNMMGIKLIA